MEAAKKPESLVAGGALVTALTTAVYLNKQHNSLSSQVDEVKDHLASTISELKQEHDKIDKHEKHISTLADGVRQLNALKIEQSEMFDYFYQVLMDRGKVIEALVESVAEMQAVMVENGTKFKNGSIRDAVDFSEQESTMEMPKNGISNDVSLRQRRGIENGKMERENNRSMYDTSSRRNIHNRREPEYERQRNYPPDIPERNVTRSNNFHSRQPDISADDFDDSEDEIEAQMRAMRNKRGNQLSMA